jgi:WD40 repeat protein
MERGAVTVAFSPDGRRLATGDSGFIQLWDVEGEQARPLTRLEHPGPVRALAFSPDGQWLLSGGAMGAARLWDLARGERWRVFEGPEGALLTVAFSSDGKRIAASGLDFRVWLWDVDSGRVLARLAGHQGLVSTVAFAPDGRHLASAGADQTVRLVGFEDPESLPSPTEHLARVLARHQLRLEGSVMVDAR